MFSSFEILIIETTIINILLGFALGVVLMGKDGKFKHMLLEVCSLMFIFRPIANFGKFLYNKLFKKKPVTDSVST